MAPAAAFPPETGDIEAYVRNRIGPAGNRSLQAVLSSLGDNPELDMESGRVSLSLENVGGEPLLEFLLEPSGRLSLGETSESRCTALFQCELPSVRSIIQFAGIVLKTVQGTHARIQFKPLSENSVLIFS